MKKVGSGGMWAEGLTVPQQFDAIKKLFSLRDSRNRHTTATHTSQPRHMLQPEKVNNISRKLVDYFVPSKLLEFSCGECDRRRLGKLRWKAFSKLRNSMKQFSSCDM